MRVRETRTESARAGLTELAVAWRQALFREHEAFKRATLLVVAHRIATVIDSDLILVMDGGAVAESGAPAELLRRPGGIFAAMHAASQHRTDGA
jgi:ABC-type multidrug transport system fused ATPase/permease subunit